MAKKKPKILIADDEPSISEALADLLELEGYHTSKVNDGDEAVSTLKKESFALLLVDLMMPGKSGLEVLEEIKRNRIPTEVIIITGKGSIDTAVDAMKAGAYDYLTKPVQPDRIRSVVPKALEHHALKQKNSELEKTIEQLTGFGEMIGQDEKMQQVYQIIDAVADTTANVFVTGESGTGKELVARAIHQKSERAAGPFIAVNCSALPGDLLENELFGHEKGAFTGAVNSKAGFFELADSGTLFLDEIGEMPPKIQSKLLRALEERSFRRLGGTSEVKVDVRVIAATNKDIQVALKDGSLREDLYFRLSVMDIELPPLRERLNDLPLLLQSFLQRFNEKNAKKIPGFSEACLKLFGNYHWPGNIRELRNVVERGVILCREDEAIEIEHLPKQIFQEQKQPDGIPAGRPLHEVEREVIFKTLEMTNQNKTKAAQLLNISLKTLHNKLNKYFQADES